MALPPTISYPPKILMFYILFNSVFIVYVIFLWKYYTQHWCELCFYFHSLLDAYNCLKRQALKRKILMCPSPFIRRRQWHPTPVLLPGKSYEWRSLVGCSPWGREESDTTEQLPFLSLFPFMHWRRKWRPTPVFLPEESQGWGAWWAAVYGVAQSRTQPKRLTSYYIIIGDLI